MTRGTEIFVQVSLLAISWCGALVFIYRSVDPARVGYQFPGRGLLFAGVISTAPFVYILKRGAVADSAAYLWMSSLPVVFTLGAAFHRLAAALP